MGSPAQATVRNWTPNRLAGSSTCRISLNAVGGMKVLRTRCRAISWTASSGSYLRARWASTVTP